MAILDIHVSFRGCTKGLLRDHGGFFDLVVDDSPTLTIQNLSQLAVFLPSTVPTKMHQPPNSKDIFTPN